MTRLGIVGPLFMLLFTAGGSMAQCDLLLPGTVAASADSICAGDTLQLEVEGFFPDSVHLQWEFFDVDQWAALIDDTTATILVAPAADISYRCSVSCGDTTAATDTLTISVTPAFELEVSGGDEEYCGQAAATLVAANADQYTWAPAIGLDTVSGASVLCVATDTTTYTVIGITGACSDTLSITVVVNPLPAQPIIDTGGGTSICAGDSLLLTCSAPGPYLWSTGATSAFIYSTEAGDYSVAVGPLGCSSLSDTIPLVVALQELPVCPAGFTVCSTDAPFDLSGATPIGGTYAVNDVPLTAFDPAVSGPTTLVTYLLTGSACPGSCTFTIDVFAAPDAGVDGSLGICADALPEPLFASLGGSPQSGGTWSGPDGTAHSGTFDPATDTPGDHSYIVPDNAGCGADTAIVAVDILDAAAPLDVLSLDDGILCDGEWADYSLVDPGPGTYTWSCNHCQSIEQTPTGATLQWTNTSGQTLSDTLHITLAAGGGSCASTTLLPVIISGSQASCPRGIVFFEPHGLAILDIPAHQFQWGTTGSGVFEAVDGATDQTWFSPGIDTCPSGFAVRTSINGECWTTTTRCADADLLERPCSREDEGLNDGPRLRVYPNPWTDGLITIAPFNTGTDAAVPVEVLDLQGRILFASAIPASGAELTPGRMHLPTCGFLLVRAFFNGRPEVLKLVVQ